MSSWRRIIDAGPCLQCGRFGHAARISAYVIAFNEAEKIGAAIESVLWADEIVVVDSHSSDGTPQIAERLGARVVQVDFEGFGKLRNSALEACRGDWIFSLDSDERCTPEVRDEVLSIVASPDALDVYRVPRRNHFMGRWIRHRAGIRTSASRSCSGVARWSTRSSRCTRATAC